MMVREHLIIYLNDSIINKKKIIIREGKTDKIITEIVPENIQYTDEGLNIIIGTDSYKIADKNSIIKQSRSAPIRFYIDNDNESRIIDFENVII